MTSKTINCRHLNSFQKIFEEIEAIAEGKDITKFSFRLSNWWSSSPLTLKGRMESFAKDKNLHCVIKRDEHTPKTFCIYFSKTDGKRQ